jgi:ribosome recycling factor
MIDDILSDARGRMSGAVDAVRREFAAIRTGRASVNVLDDVRVDYYGSMMPVNQVATLSVPDARLIVIQPWDKSLIGTIERAITAANLGINPQNDGIVIRLPIPPLNEARRKDLVKQARKKAEDGKVGVRGIRRDAKEMIEELEKDGDVSKDESHRAVESLQSLTDSHTSSIDSMTEAKEKEIMEI